MIGPYTRRLMVRFSALVTVTTVIVLLAGGLLLEREMLRSMEGMHEVEADEVFEVLRDHPGLKGDDLAGRIDTKLGSDAALYFIQIHDDRGAILYRSENLGDAVMPDLSRMEENEHVLAELPGVGGVRLSEFREGEWHVQIASRLKPVHRILTNYAKVSALLVLGTAVASLGLGYAFSRFTLRPVRAIELTARRISADNLRERIPVLAVRDELADLAMLLNQMFDRLEGSFEQVKRFTADASHELKTPLALIRLNAERLRTRLAGDPEAVAGLEDLLEEITRMNRIIESLLFIAKAESGALLLDLKEHDVRALLAPFVEDARVLAEDRGVRFELARDDAGSLRLEPALLRQLLLNLVANALNVSPAGGLVTLESVQTEHGWWFIVTDEGPGLPAAQLEKIFERFVRFEPATGENRARGHGLGLAICRSIAELHDGEIRAENRTDGRSGLRVVVALRR
ncbi:ATP-binding protein [Rariglobus hedericola]|uniref:histidine kinase n=1 Tax=Rariglobus hedericola TaxID=2597822 RepID=A0A556QJ78_9BACT|nr:ATP-binding protein [Rariglobus hedericola]TSJ76703.1 HAMP domain-containing protein [Rariglobus hedericola]